jgi:hypothetical protein
MMIKINNKSDCITGLQSNRTNRVCRYTHIRERERERKREKEKEKEREREKEIEIDFKELDYRVQPVGLGSLQSNGKGQQAGFSRKNCSLSPKAGCWQNFLD